VLSSGTRRSPVGPAAQRLASHRVARAQPRLCGGRAVRLRSIEAGALQHTCPRAHSCHCTGPPTQQRPAMSATPTGCAGTHSFRCQMRGTPAPPPSSFTAPRRTFVRLRQWLLLRAGGNAALLPLDGATPATQHGARARANILYTATLLSGLGHKLVGALSLDVVGNYICCCSNRILLSELLLKYKALKFGRTTRRLSCQDRQADQPLRSPRKTMRGPVAAPLWQPGLPNGLPKGRSYLTALGEAPVKTSAQTAWHIYNVL